MVQVGCDDLAGKALSGELIERGFGSTPLAGPIATPILGKSVFQPSKVNEWQKVLRNRRFR